MSKWMGNVSFGSPKILLGNISLSVEKVTEAVEAIGKIAEERNKKYSERVARKVENNAK